MQQTSDPKQNKPYTDHISDNFLQSFMEKFKQSWQTFDHEFDEMDKRIKDQRKLNGKATNHEINL